jgi:hypothetical protein
VAVRSLENLLAEADDQLQQQKRLRYGIPVMPA